MSDVTLSWVEFSHAVEDVLLRQSTSATKGLNHATTYERDFLTRLIRCIHCLT
jgi:hypothetical protein